LNFVTIYLNFGAIYLNFGAKIENSLFEGWEGRGWLGPSGPPGGLGIGIGKKISAHPLFAGRYQVPLSSFAA